MTPPVSRDMTGEADGMHLEVDSRDEVMHIRMSVERSVIFNEEVVGGQGRVTTYCAQQQMRAE